MSELGYRVSATEVDPEDPESFEFVGGRKTLNGAEGLARRILGKARSIGFYATGTGGMEVKADGTTKRCRIEKGWYEP